MTTKRKQFEDLVALVITDVFGRHINNELDDKTLMSVIEQIADIAEFGGMLPSNPPTDRGQPRIGPDE
jgi:hypothetical protein